MPFIRIVDVSCCFRLVSMKMDNNNKTFNNLPDACRFILKMKPAFFFDHHHLTCPNNNLFLRLGNSFHQLQHRACLTGRLSFILLYSIHTNTFRHSAISKNVLLKT